MIKRSSIFNFKRIPAAFLISFAVILLTEGLFLTSRAWSVDAFFHPWLLPDWGKDGDFREDPQLAWRLMPQALVEISQGKEHLNAQGWRGPEIIEPKKGFRIACLGDSTTFGVFSQDERETYPRQLESFLRMSGGCETCEVLNLGTNGYGTLHGAILMKETVPALKADAVIAYFGWNDRTRIVGWQDHREKIQFVQSPWNRSALVRWLIRTSDPWIQNLRFSRKLRFFAGPSWVKHGAALAEVEENLKTFIKRSREKGIAPVLVTTPWGWPEEFLTKYTLAMPAEKQAMTPSVYSMVYNIHQYNDLVRKTAEETGALFVDLEAVFRKIPSKERPSFFYSDFMHPNSQGAHLIAESLAPAVHDVIKNST